MSWLMLSDVARMLDAEFHGEDVEIGAVSTDTRRIQFDELFFALEGPNFDAHEVLDDQPDIPLAALVVSREVKHPAPYILVDNTREALGRLAAAWRAELDVKVIGLTGSNGKTTVKEMIAGILMHTGETLATIGNLNNEIGVPLTLLRLRRDHRFAVIEMGAGGPGDIAYLASLAKPDIGLLINANEAHLKGFGSVEGVANAKAELFDALPDKSGIAIVNLDSPFASDWLQRNEGRQVVTFGVSEEADYRVESFAPLELSLNGERLSLELQMHGRHNALNAAAAAAAAMALGASAYAAELGLQSVEPQLGRLRYTTGPKGSSLIDDTYNANPASVRAAIEVLATAEGKRILVLGDMAELGEQAEALHREIGMFAREQGVDALWAVGSLSALAAEAFGEGGQVFGSAQALAAKLEVRLDADTTALIKGSRAAKMERVLDALTASTFGMFLGGPGDAP